MNSGRIQSEIQMTLFKESKQYSIFVLKCNNITFQAAMYGMAQSIPDSRLIEEIAENFVDVLYTTK